MISTHETIKLGKVTAEVNWSPEVTPCKKIRLSVDGHTEEIDHGELYLMLMMFGTPEEQEELIPDPKQVKMVKIRRLLHIRVKKDMKAGEMLIFPYRYDVTQEQYDQLVKENPRQYGPAAEGAMDISTAEETIAKLGKDV